MQERLLNLTQETSNLNTDLQVAEQSDQYNDATKHEYENQLNELKKNLSSLTEKEASLQKEVDQVATQEAALAKKRDGYAQSLHSDPETLSKELENLRNDYIQSLQDQTSNNNDLVYAENELKRLNNAAMPELKTAEAELEKAEAELTQLKQQGQEASAKKNNLQNQVQLKSDLINDLTAKQNLANRSLQDISQKYQAAKAQKEALENIQKRHEGYYYGVRNILNHLDQYQGVIGAVGELLDFPAELEAALTTALGGGVQDLVTDTKQSSRNAIMQLKQNRMGRATFLPLDGLRFSTIPSSTVTTLKSMPGFIGVASELVKTKGQVDISVAVNYLLGNVIVADTIDNAMKINSRIYRYRIVTLDGDVISPGGSMSGGAKNQRNNSPLQTAGEINKLTKAVNELVAGVKAAKEKIITLDKKISKEKKIFASLNDELQVAIQDLSALALSYQNKESEVKRLKEAHHLYQNRADERAAEIKRLEEKIKEKKQIQTQINDRLEKQKQAMAEKKDQIDDFANLNKDVQAKLAELNPKLAVLHNQKNKFES